jgi:hypothetical protein
MAQPGMMQDKLLGLKDQQVRLVLHQLLRVQQVLPVRQELQAQLVQQDQLEIPAQRAQKVLLLKRTPRMTLVFYG